jgi:hypothetical protein
MTFVLMSNAILVLSRRLNCRGLRGMPHVPRRLRTEMIREVASNVIPLMLFVVTLEPNVDYHPLRDLFLSSYSLFYSLGAGIRRQ